MQIAETVEATGTQEFNTSYRVVSELIELGYVVDVVGKGRFRVGRDTRNHEN